MNASNLVAEAVWNEIESTRSDFTFCLGRTLKELQGSLTKEVSRKSPVSLAVGASFRFQYMKKLSDCIMQNYGLQVMGESQRKEEYFCFPESYCACYSFFYDIISRGEQLCCKHQLAARLAASLGKCVETRVPDEELAVLLSEL